MDHATEITFRFVEFNPRRHRRGAVAAWVEVLEDGDATHCLWMSKKDIGANIKLFGECPELQKALAAYKNGEENATD